MASVIHRGSRFDFDDEYCRCDEDTSGQFDKCPVCVPEQFTDPDRLLDWLSQADNAVTVAHVYEVARGWLEVEDLGDDPERVGLVAALDLVAQFPHDSYDAIERWLQPGDPDAPLRERKLTGHATRLFLGGRS